jgi:hypothetical protein
LGVSLKKVSQLVDARRHAYTGSAVVSIIETASNPALELHRSTDAIVVKG